MHGIRALISLVRMGEEMAGDPNRHSDFCPEIFCAMAQPCPSWSLSEPSALLFWLQWYVAAPPWPVRSQCSSLAHPPAHSSTHTPTRSHTHPLLTRTVAHPFTYTSTRSHTHSPLTAYLYSHSSIYPLTRSLFYLHTHSLTRSPLTYPYGRSSIYPLIPHPFTCVHLLTQPPRHSSICLL